MDHVLRTYLKVQPDLTSDSRSTTQNSYSSPTSGKCAVARSQMLALRHSGWHPLPMTTRANRNLYLYESSVADAARRAVLTHVGNRLRRSRKDAGLTQTDVAPQIPVSVQTLRNWESGRFEPSPHAINRLAEIYGIEERSFFADIQLPIPTAKRTPARGFRYDRVPIDPDKLANARRHANLTQAQASKAVRVSLSAIRRYEAGKANPEAKVLELMADLYDRPVNWFAAATNQPVPYQTRPALPDDVRPLPSTISDIVLDTYIAAAGDLSERDKSAIAKFITYILQHNRSARFADSIQDTLTPY